MQKLGQYLKKQREKQNLSLEDLATRTKIHIQKLEHIEKGQRDKLPAKVFCIGLIKSYARELRVDMEQVNQLIDEAFAEPTSSASEPVIETPAPKNPTSSTQEDQMVGLFKVPKIVMIAASGLLSLLLLFFIFQVVEKMNAYSKEEALPKEVFVLEDEAAENDKPEANNDGQTSSDAQEKDKTSESVSAAESSENKDENPQAVVTELSEESQPETPEKESTVEATRPTVPPMDMSDGDFSEDNFGGPPVNTSSSDVVSDNKLTLTALEPIRAEVVWSDGYVQVMLLKSNESKTLVFSQPITLRVNNGGAVQVSFNESEKKVPGPFNKPIEIQYP